MKTFLTTLVALSLAGVIYAEDNTNKTVSAKSDAGEKTEKDKDNTANNQRDKSGETLTPEDQSNAPEDIQLTAAIRRLLGKDDALSTNAKNVKIIAIQGAVTLRGTVNSEGEKNQVATKAKAIAGIKELKNELNVKRTNIQPKLNPKLENLTL